MTNTYAGKLTKRALREVTPSQLYDAYINGSSLYKRALRGEVRSRDLNNYDYACLTHVRNYGYLKKEPNG